MSKSAKSAIRVSKLTSIVFWLFAGTWLFLAAMISRGADRVTEPVDVAHLIMLPHHIPAWASAENDVGEVADDLQLSHLTLVLKRSPQQQLAFDQLLTQQQDPNSPNFHRWLTPVQVGEQFGASEHDMGAITQWLQSQGLHVDLVANSRFRIDFSGSAANVGAAFGTRLHSYLVNGERRLAPADVPKIPAALLGLVQSVHGLATSYERTFHSVRTAQVPTLVENPLATNCSPSGCVHYVWPADFATIYDLNSV